MAQDDDLLRSIATFPKLVGYLRDELQWPIEEASFDDLTFDYEADELGLDPKTAVKIRSIKQLRPLTAGQPWGVFFVEFERKRLPVVVMRRILSVLALKKRASAGKGSQAAWQASDLLFVSSFGEEGGRGITFAHFAPDDKGHDLPALKVLGWDGDDTKLHTRAVAESLASNLVWPSDESDAGAWRAKWSSAFVLANRYTAETSRELSMKLARLAVGIRERAKAILAAESARGPLRRLHDAFKQALLHDLDEDGFADMYAQTVAYGLLAARLENPDSPTPLTASALADMIPPTSPFLKGLLLMFLKVGGQKKYINFDELGIGDVVDLLRHADMKAILLDFGDLKPDEDPVLHFYELFLDGYDHAQKMQRGVFYTPKPVVHYIVHSIDHILRTEFGLADGLADTTTWGEMASRRPGVTIPKGLKPDDPFVQVLDPATGTATFLVEVIDVIYSTMTAKWRGQGKSKTEMETLWNEYVPRHLLPRLYGFELLVAPYTIAHIKFGLKLRETGYRFGSTARACIYLTNTLEDPDKFADTFDFDVPPLADEARAVSRVKRTLKPTVVLGNPPYAGTSSNPAFDEKGESTLAGRLVDEYKMCDGRPLGEQNSKYLQDDYVKFIRFSQWKIAQAGVGILGFITNHGYLDNPTFRGMRQSLMASFDQLHALNLHGSSKRKERCPDGQKDENVFDIMPGVAILIATRMDSLPKGVWQADLWGTRESKYVSLAHGGCAKTPWQGLEPRSSLYLFIPQDALLAEEYDRWTKITDVFPLSVTGFKTHRDHFAVAFERACMEHRLSDMLDRNLSDLNLKDEYNLTDNRDWQLSGARERLRQFGDKWHTLIQTCAYRPFDVRWCCFDEVAMDYPRRELKDHVAGRENICLMTSRQQATQGFYHCWVTDLPAEICLISSTTKESDYVFPLYVYEDSCTISTAAVGRGSLYGAPRSPNLSPALVQRLMQLYEKRLAPESVIAYVYGILNSQLYRARYAQLLRMDFPRIPFVVGHKQFVALAEKGQQLIDLHLMRSPKLDNPISDFRGQSDGTISKVEYDAATGHVSINSTQYFDRVTPEVWSYRIGGHQVLSKWLKDRGPKGGELGRVLSSDDVLHYRKIVTAISKTIELQVEIDRFIVVAGGFPAAFVTDQQ